MEHPAKLSDASAYHPANAVSAAVAQETLSLAESARENEDRPWRGLPGFERAFAAHLEAAERFYASARLIGGDACPVSEPQGDWRAPGRHFFSAFFLAVTRPLCRDERRLPLYAMTNMAIRVWVTACDNLLDDEYKETLGFRLPEGGPRMRSVLSIMVADRVLAEYVQGNYPETALGLSVARCSLRALMPSAVQELEEERRPVPVLPPEALIRSIHQRKTADLFAAPLVLPAELERPDAARLAAARRAVTALGLGCQALDDIKDMPADAASGRHNLLVSIEAERRGELGWLDDLRRLDPSTWRSWIAFPDACAQAGLVARRSFADCFAGLNALGLVATEEQWRAVVLRVTALLGVPPEALRRFGGPSAAAVGTLAEVAHGR